MSGLRLYYEIIVKDKNGKTIKKFRRKSKSFVKNFAIMIRNLFVIPLNTYDSNSMVLDTAGINRGYPYASSLSNKAMAVDAGTGNDTYGIVVGTGTTSPTVDDVNLVSKIANGTATGQLSYGSTTVEYVTTTATQSQFRIIRTFTNNSGANITVNEIGIIVRWTDIGGTRYGLIIRDVITSTTIPAGSTLTVRYIFTFPV